MHTYTIQWVGPLTYDEYKEEDENGWDGILNVNYGFLLGGINRVHISSKRTK